MSIKIERFETIINDQNKDKIKLDGGISVSDPKGGCGLQGCFCSPGHWISIIEPLQDGKVKGTRFRFDSREELEIFKGEA